MRKKVRKWLDLILFMGKPEDTSEGHALHDYKEELPQAVNPRLAGVVKILLGLGLTVLVIWLLVKLFS